MTERKATEEVLRQTQNMEAIGQLTGGVAHDFNNLLTVIIGSLDRACRRIEDEALTRLIGNALQAAHRGASLTQRLLAFARRQNLDPQVVSIAALVESLQPLLKSSLPSTISLAFEVSAATPLVKVNPPQLEMALLNLVVNARHDQGWYEHHLHFVRRNPASRTKGRKLCVLESERPVSFGI